MGGITADDIQRWQKKRKIGKLIEALGDREVREEAAEALEKIGESKAVE